MFCVTNLKEPLSTKKGKKYLWKLSRIGFLYMTKHFERIMANKSKNATSFAKSKEDLRGMLMYSKAHAAKHEREQSKIFKLRDKKLFLPETKF